MKVRVGDAGLEWGDLVEEFYWKPTGSIMIYLRRPDELDLFHFFLCLSDLEIYCLDHDDEIKIVRRIEECV